MDSIDFHEITRGTVRNLIKLESGSGLRDHIKMSQEVFYVRSFYTPRGLYSPGSFFTGLILNPGGPQGGGRGVSRGKKLVRAYGK